MKIGILGLGYVGIVNVACLSKQGHTVYCTDVKKQKVIAVKEGKSPILEPHVEELIQSGLEKGLIIPTEDVKELVENSEILMTCVGTPSKLSGEVNLDYLTNVVIEICSFLKPEDSKYLVFRSTVPPGTTEMLSGKYLTSHFPHIQTVFYPEFLREGTAVKDFFNYGRFVLGGDTFKNYDALVDILNADKTAPVYITDYKTSEYAKYIDNGFHALKVVWANEIFGLGAELGVNVHDSHQIFVADDKLNISSRYLRPGTPFGGSCLPKDVRELQHLKTKSNRSFKLIESLIPSNDSFINDIIQKIKAFEKVKLGFVGITFKNHSDDLRESPLLRILLALRQEESQYQIAIFDEDINSANVRIEFPYLFSGIKKLEAVIEESELLIVSKRYLEQVLVSKRPNQIVLNLSDNKTASNKDLIYNLYCPKA
jgi:GDP-mannose 6-dehydrogenase